MNAKHTENLQELLATADLLADDILQMSDEEILAEARERYDDVDAEIERLRGLVSAAVLKANKSKLHAAQRAVQAAKGGSKESGQVVDLLQVRAKLKQLAHSDERARDNILLAAREASVPLEELPEDELRGLYEDMKDLGFFDEDA